LPKAKSKIIIPERRELSKLLLIKLRTKNKIKGKEKGKRSKRRSRQRIKKLMFWKRI